MPKDLSQLERSADIFSGAKSTTPLSVDDFWRWCHERAIRIADGKLYFLITSRRHADEISKNMLAGGVEEARYVCEVLDVLRPADHSALQRVLKNPHNWFVIYKPVEPFQRPDFLFDGTHIFRERDNEHAGVFEIGALENLEDPLMPLCDLDIPPVEVIVQDLLIKGGVHVIAGMPGGNKSIWCMELASADIGKRKVSDQFEVYSSHPFIWACLDMDPSFQKMWAEPFGLAREEMADSFLVINPKCDTFSIDNPAFTAQVNGHIVILDTMWDFANITKASESGEWVAFFQKLRRLINKFGCVAIILLVHPTKAGAAASSTELAAWLKDSITFAGKADIVFAFSPRPGTSQTLVERIKHRGFKKKDFRFTITTTAADGTNYLDSGRFPVYEKPGEAISKQAYAAKRGPKGDPAREGAIEWLMSQEHVTELIATKVERLNRHFKSKHPVSTVKTWLQRARKERAEQSGDLYGDFVNEVVTGGSNE